MATTTVQLQPLSTLTIGAPDHTVALPIVPPVHDREQLRQTPETPVRLTRLRAVFIVITVAGISFLSSLCSGVLTVALRNIAEDIHLAGGLLLWPASVYALATGCVLLPVGTVADAVGNRPVFLTGCALLAIFTLGCALAQTGIQLIIFRAFQGVSMAFCMPTSVGIVTSTFPQGTSRNIAFASLGGGQPFGYALGLVLGGVFVDTIGWRWGFYLACIFNALILCAASFTLPKSSSRPDKWRRLSHDIDWVGAVLASTALGLLSYVFA